LTTAHAIRAMLTGQYADKPTCGQTTGQFAYWITRRLDDVWTSQLADREFLKISFGAIIYSNF